MDHFLPSSVSISIAILALSFAIFWAKIVFSEKKKKRYAPIVGTVFHLLINFARVHDYMTAISRKLKTYRFLDPFLSLVFTSEPGNVEYMLKTNFNNFGKGQYHYVILTDLLGDGIFTVDGEKWRQQRKLSSYEFSTRNLREFSSEAFREIAVTLAQVVSQAANSNQAIEVQDLFMKSTLDSVFKVVLGVDLNSMCGTNEEGNIFTNKFDEASAITLQRYVDVFWKIKRFLNIGSEKTMKSCIQIVDAFVYKIINSKIAQHNRDLQDGVEMKKHDILSRFLDLNETDPKYLKDIILSFIIAGKDTTASTLSWFLYMICKHPSEQEKIAQEDGKVCFEDDTFPDGTSVRKGDQVAYQPYVMGRMKRLWGDDAEEFRPERWLNEDGIFQQQSPFKFTAFQAGPRICLGKDFAYRQMKIFASVLLGSFVFKLNDEKKPVNYKTMLTLHVDGGLHLRAHHRFPN